MAHDRRRPPHLGTAPRRAVIIICGLNFIGVIIASGQTDPRAWWVVAGVGIVSAVCVAALLASRRRR